ncbi:MAG: hypothetical protein JWL76_1439 [Thermoleophilia bacterium]|nr:hypothetical protein [Thermoleophilia bacterium]
MSDSTQQLAPEDIARRVKWKKMILATPELASAAGVLFLLSVVLVVLFDVGGAAWFTGLLASLISALLLAGILFKAQELLKKELVASYNRQLELQKQIRAELEEERRENARQREWIEKTFNAALRPDAAQHSARPREPSTDAESSPESFGETDDDPPDAPLEIITPLEAWWYQHRRLIGRALRLTLFVLSFVLVVGWVLQWNAEGRPLPSLPAMPSPSWPQLQNSPDGGHEREARPIERPHERERDGDDAPNGANEPDDQNAAFEENALPNRNQNSGQVAMPRGATASPPAGKRSALHHPSPARIQAFRRLRALNRVMHIDGGCHAIPSIHTTAIAREQCRDRGKLMTVYAFRTPAAAAHYYEMARVRPSLRTWDCHSMQHIGDGYGFTYGWRSYSLEGRLLITNARGSAWMWNSLVLEC